MTKKVKMKSLVMLFVVALISAACTTRSPELTQDKVGGGIIDEFIYGKKP